MKCPHCNSTNIGVIDTLGGAVNTIYRRRKCKSCGELFRTVEIIDNGQNPSVAKGYAAAMKRKVGKRCKNEKQTTENCGN